MRATGLTVWVTASLALLNGSAVRAGEGFSVLHSVCAHENCGAGGAGTSSGLLRDAAGNLYGASMRGGANGAGEIFEMSPRTDGKDWNYARLYSFCPRGSCAHGGAILSGPLIVDIDGNLYGATMVGGKGGFGAFFELLPNAGRRKWSMRVLRDFCAHGGSSCPEADYMKFGLTYAGAASGAPYDGESPLYGASAYGGYGWGNVYSLTPRAGKKRWAFRQVYEFCGGGYPQCPDGALPWLGNVVADATGNLYGTAMLGGVNNAGVVYEIALAGGNRGTETILHNFCSLADCADGASPSGTLLLDSAGNLYGTTGSGPSNCADSAQCGVVFRLSPGSPWQETVLHTFCQLAGCADGSSANGGLVMDAAGNLVGSTFTGGAQSAGTVFRLGQSFTVLHAFCSEPDCADGQYPQSAIALDAAGPIFGLTQNGGTGTYGAVFEEKR